MQFVREISLLLNLLICICEWSSASFSANEFGLSDIKFKLMLLMLQFSLSRESTKDFLDEMEKLLLENSFLKETFLFGELIANFLLLIQQITFKIKDWQQCPHQSCLRAKHQD